MIQPLILKKLPLKKCKILHLSVALMSKMRKILMTRQFQGANSSQTSINIMIQPLILGPLPLKNCKILRSSVALMSKMRNILMHGIKM